MNERMELSGFRRRLLVFNSALGKARTAYGSTDQLNDMEELAYSYVPWYNQRGKQSLQHFMLHLDAEKNVRENTGSNKVIYDDIYTIMNSIMIKTAEKKSQLTGSLVKMGSAHNHMKINQPDEFDFTFELDINILLNNNAAKIRTVTSDRNRVLVLVDFEGERPDVAEFDIVGYPKDPQLDMLLSLNGNKDAERYKSMLSEHGDLYVLNTEAIAFALFNVLDSVVSKLDLPANWSHGGYNYPNYSGLRLNIPAYLIQFAYHSPGTETPLLISVDFAPVLKLPNNLRYQSGDLIDEYLDKNGYIEYQWQRLERGTVKGGYNSFAEEKWLSTYASDSVPKVVVRVCKALHNMVNLSTPKYLSKSIATKIADYRRSKEHDQERTVQEINDDLMTAEQYSVKIGQLSNDTDYATLLDIYEVVGGHDYVSSYIFKRIVMTLMTLDESQGRKWTLNDVPDLVLSVFMIINDLIMSVNQAALVIGSSTQTKEEMGLVFTLQPRSDVIQGTAEAENVRQQSKMTEVLEIQLNHLKNKYEERDIYVRSQGESDHRHSLKSYFRLHEAIREGKCKGIANLFLRDQFSGITKAKGLDDGIGRVLDLLQCVAAGESKALINIHRHSIQDEELNIEECLITRKELAILLINNTFRL